jgi:hypothetical protein
MKYYIKQSDIKKKNYTTLKLTYCISVGKILIIIKVLTLKHISINIYADGFIEAVMLKDYEKFEKKEFKTSLRNNIKSNFKLNLITLISIIIKLISIFR